MNKLLIVDDHRIFTDGIRFLIDHTTDLKVTGVLHLGKDVLPFLSSNKVDMIMLDIDIPDMSGFEIAEMVRTSYPMVKILALSMLDDIGSMERMFAIGAEGYCIKSDGRDEVFKALQTLRDGGRYWPPVYLRMILNRQGKMSEQRLTAREIEITRLICQGVTSADIADKLFLSTRTVETHRRNVYRKVNVHNNIELVHYAKKHLII